MDFLGRVVSAVPPDTDVLVDVANVGITQLQDVHRRYRHPLYVSTHKTFDHQQSQKRGAGAARWLVLQMPEQRDGVTWVGAFDHGGQRFTRRRGRSPVKLRYSPHARPSQCRISSPEGETAFAHEWCEVDDDTIAVMSHRTHLPVVTNDRQLGRRVASKRLPSVARQTRMLMRHTTMTLLGVRGGRWVKLTTRRQR